MTATPLLLQRTEQLCADALALLDGEPAAASIASVRAGLAEPLRVAVAGRVKAGKSTLVNALVGERLAPTDAGECTRIPTWYRDGIGYSVVAIHADGRRSSVPFTRDSGRLSVGLDERAAADVDGLVVEWPSARLTELTLIDTPGLGSTSGDLQRRTERLLGAGEGGRGDVDAVIYLMRHLHSIDSRFLESFADPSLPGATPLNAVAVLSRADELAGGRLDAMDSARAVADRYLRDRRMLRLCGTVVPVAGLLAETAATLREDEAALLRAIADDAAEELGLTLLSADRFVDADLGVGREARRDLVRRLGMFGVRFCLDRIRAGVRTSAQLAAALTEESGIEHLRAAIDERIASRAAVLKARSAVARLRAIAATLRGKDPTRAAALADAIDRLESTTHEFAEIALVDRLAAGEVALTEQQAAEALQVLTAGGPLARLGLAEGATDAEARAAALDRIAYWRAEASHPLAESAERHAASILTRSYEALYAQVPAVN